TAAAGLGPDIGRSEVSPPLPSVPHHQELPAPALSIVSNVPVVAAACCRPWATIAAGAVAAPAAPPAPGGRGPAGPPGPGAGDVDPLGRGVHDRAGAAVGGLLRRQPGDHAG